MVDELWQEITAVEDDKKPSRWRKLLVVLGSLLLVLLIISYIFASYPLNSIIIGKLHAAPFEGNVVRVEDFSLIFQNDTEKIVQSFYLAKQDEEFSLCLLGQREGTDYFITAVYQPKIFRQSFNEVVFEPCSQETIAILHSHPYKHCVASKTDLDTLRKVQERNPETIMIVMCEKGKISVYS